MYIPITLFNVLTLGMLAATVWVAIKRFTLPVDSNWPLAYYAILVAYCRAYAYSLDNYWVLAGLLCGLLLRFEFLGGAAVKLIRAVEIGVFVYVVGRCAVLLLQW